MRTSDRGMCLSSWLLWQPVSDRCVSLSPSLDPFRNQTETNHKFLRVGTFEAIKSNLLLKAGNLKLDYPQKMAEQAGPEKPPARVSLRELVPLSNHLHH